jgi:hypothetical protein
MAAVTSQPVTAAAAAGSMMVPAEAAAMLHGATQSGQLDALISGLVNLTAVLQQIQQTHAQQ